MPDWYLATEVDKVQGTMCRLDAGLKEIDSGIYTSQLLERYFGKGE